MIKIRFILLLVFTFLICSESYNQEYVTYHSLRKFSNWSLVAGPALYLSARTYPQYGNSTIKNNPIWGFNAGFEYDLFPAKKLSFSTGLILALEPIYNAKVLIEQKDLYPQFTEDMEDKYRGYSLITFSIPLLARLCLQINQNSFLNFYSGLKVMYYPTGEAYLTVAISNEDQTETREIFGLKLQTQDQSFYGSFVIGVGYSYTIQKVLLKVRAVYNWNFQNTIEGEYQFANLLSSPPSRGYYELSGNYLAVQFTVSFLKRKKNRLYF